MKNLIVTADDFGISKEVNDAVETAHKHGILSATSLMVGEPFAADAIQRAHAMPDLGVGLHVALSRAHPLSAANDIPDLIDARGMLRADLVGAGFRFFFRPAVRRQLRTEITAQFEAFARSGLALDHVNAHNHLHLHPTVMGLLLDIGPGFGMKSVRLPAAPAPKSAMDMFLTPWLALMKSRLRDNAIRHNDVLLGLSETGSMDSAAMIALIDKPWQGTAELMVHPATGPWDGMDPMAGGYRHDREYQALIDGDVIGAIRDRAINLTTYKQLA